MPSALPRKLRERVEVVLDRLRPALLADGGNVELAEVADDGTVSVVLQGACATCPAQSTTVRHGLEAGLRREIPEITAVIALPS